MATGMSAKKATSMGAICTVICCLICCGIPGLAGLVILNNTIGTWPVVDGTVISTRICESTGSSNNNGDPTYYVTFNYTTTDGMQITSETDYCTNFYPSVGETEQIMYDPDEPTSIVEEEILDIGLYASKAATGIGFGLGAIACVVAVMMCMKPDPPANPETYQANAYETNNAYETHNAYETNNNAYNNQPYGGSSVPTTGPAGDIPTPMATAVPLTPAVVYNGASTTPVSSGPATYYK